MTATPPPLTDAVAAQIRETAWTPAMRRSYRDLPGYWTSCACQWGCPACERGDHHRCPRHEPLRRPMGHVMRTGGTHAAHHAEPHQHPTPTATGPKHTTQAQVWLADHACAWECRCGCRKDDDQGDGQDVADQTAQETAEDVADQTAQETAEGAAKETTAREAAPAAPEPASLTDDPTDAQILAWVRARGLVDADADRVTPPMRRAYAAQVPTERAAAARRQHAQAELEHQFAQAAENRARHEAKQARRERIRAWAEQHRYPVGRSIPPSTERAYQVAMEGADGQPGLF
ncbi:hypothetical protein [Actinomadura kijaniata]|uniref:hypothetical protein n=1 Tax=Actinomadura kijaniata TaxID=46161 RepID=UPI0008306322|nr:hypothetical protein [Actinomadura kijaniata]